MRLVYWTALWTFLADQILKIGVVQFLDLKTRGSIDVLPPFLKLRMAWNTGVNFGLFSAFDMKWVLIAIAVVISAAVLVWLHRTPSMGRAAKISGGLLVGGALGNVVDRFVYGAVADFLNMSWYGFENPYAFNVADIAIFLGALGLVFFSSETKTPQKKG